MSYGRFGCPGSPAGNRVRKVDGKGIITTVAGNGKRGFGGDGGAATSARLADPFSVAVDSAGNLYIAEEGNNRIRKVDRNDQPYGLTVDRGTLYLTDTFNARVRIVRLK